MDTLTTDAPKSVSLSLPGDPPDLEAVLAVATASLAVAERARAEFAARLESARARLVDQTAERARLVKALATGAEGAADAVAVADRGITETAGMVDALTEALPVHQRRVERATDGDGRQKRPLPCGTITICSANLIGFPRLPRG